MARKPAPEVKEIPLVNVVAAAIVAYEQNGQHYYKESFNQVDEETGNLLHEVIANKMIVRGSIKDNFVPTQYQAQAAEQLINDAQLSLMMAQLSATRPPSSFEQSMIAATSVPFVKSNDYLSIGILAFLPEFQARAKQSAEIQEKVAFAKNEPVGNIGSRVLFLGEVTKSVYSAKWNTFYITVLTDKNQIVWFSYRSDIPVGSSITGNGTVKRLADTGTQLNRVKVK